MSESDRSEAQFRAEDEAPELEDYRPISGLAIAACLSSVASLLAIAHPLLWVVPVVTVLLSIVAIVRISAPQSRYGGRGAAVCALCFAMLIVGYAPARSISRDRSLYSRSRARVEEFIALLQQGQVMKAHQISLDTHDRFQGPGSLTEHYAEKPPHVHSADEDMMEHMTLEEPASNELKMFSDTLGTKDIIEFGESGRFEHLENVGISFEYQDLKMTHRYRISGIRDGQPVSVEFLIRATRRQSNDFYSWIVGQIEVVE